MASRKITQAAYVASSARGTHPWDEWLSLDGIGDGPEDCAELELVRGVDFAQETKHFPHLLKGAARKRGVKVAVKSKNKGNTIVLRVYRASKKEREALLADHARRQERLKTKRNEKSANNGTSAAPETSKASAHAANTKGQRKLAQS